jgi:hypothetical protein
MEPVPDAVLYGFEKNYRVGTFGPKHTPCILADWYLFPDRADEADRRPYRSVEYYHTMRLIRGTAAMVNDPFLDMGIVAYDRPDGFCLYALGDGDMPGPMDANLPGDDTTKPRDKTKPQAGAEKPEAPKHTPEEEELFERCRAYMMSKYGLDETWPAAKKAEPDEPDEAAPGAGAKKPARVTPMSTDKVPDLYTKQMGEMRARLAGLELERDQERCQVLLYSLEQEGFCLSADEKKKELAKLAKLPQSERSDRVRELKAIYAVRKVPDGRMELYTGHVEGGDPTEGSPFAKPWYHDAAMVYMLANPGVQYDAACTHVRETAAKK